MENKRKVEPNPCLIIAQTWQLEILVKPCINQCLFTLFCLKFGEADSRTKESSEYLKHCTQQAVLIQKKVCIVSSGTAHPL